MTMETASARSGTTQASPSTPPSKGRNLPRPLNYIFKTTSKSLQLKSIWSQLSFDQYTVAMAIKASIPPTILVCAIQSDTWINYFQTNAYLAALISTCTLPSLPRARLVEYNLQLAFVFAVSYCWVLLAGWSGLQARKHTVNNPAEMANYNSSAEAVVAIFLMFWIWCTFTLKSAFPTWSLQCTLGGIYAVATIPAVAQGDSMGNIINTASVTFEAFLVGQAVGFFNALLVFPQSCRGVFKNEMKACLDGLVAIVRAQTRCMDDFRLKRLSAEGEEERVSSVNQLQSALQVFINNIVKARGDVEYAGREISWGRLEYPQLECIASVLVDLIPPASGLSSAANMLQLAVDEYYPSKEADGMESRSKTESDLEHEEIWNQLEETMHRQSHRISDAIIEGVEHVKRRLELTEGRPLLSRLRVKKTDEENQAFSMNPGEASFLGSYRTVFDNCCAFSQGPIDGISGERLLDHYIRHRPQVRDPSQVTPETHTDTLRYFLLLHSQTLLSSLGDELFKILLCVEESHARPKRLIIPHINHLKYWINLFSHLEGTQQDNQPTDPQANTNIELGPAFYHRRDPEHLPPATVFEATGDKVRKIVSVFRTNHAAYGLRGVCAIMTITIIAFLRASQDFYSRQRFLWALFAILFSMGRTAGSSTFLLLGRVFGTTASMIASYIIWYIVDEKTPGILVFLWVWFAIIGYLFVVFPRFSSVWIVALIAAIVMIGNQLQVRQLGEAAVMKAGQEVYPPYIIFPYRLAVVMLGVVTAYFWTIFPYPLSEHSELRNNIAKSIYMLANFYMCIHQIILARLHRTYDHDNDNVDKSSPSFHLQIARRRIFRKFQTLTTTAKTYFQFLDWEFALGGRFPKKSYSDIIAILDRIGGYMTLAGYVSRALKRLPAESTWWTADQTNTAHEHLALDDVSTRLIILHSALSRAHPLPPQLKELQMPDLSDFLSRDVPAEEGFAVTALIHTVNWYMINDINRLTQVLKELLGELDFSFTINLAGTRERASIDEDQ